MFLRGYLYIKLDVNYRKINETPFLLLIRQ
jgi:hypothetical protein